MSCPVVALVAGVNSGSGSWSDSFNPGRKLDAADRARRFVLLPSRAGKVAARHALDRKHLGAHHHHGTAAEFIGVLANRRRVAVHVGSDEMVGDDVLEKVEPEQRDLRQHPPLVRNAGRQHVVEGRDAVGGHEQQVVTIEVIDVADLAAGVQLQFGVVRSQQNGI